MSETLRIALVAEGVTDFVVLNAAMESMLEGRSFDLKLLQPEGSVAFAGSGDAGQFGGGWRGVHKWCLQARERSSGGIRDDVLFTAYDLLVLHLDADVAGEDPANYSVYEISGLAGVLPCDRPCPPASDTTDRLRQVLLSWIGESMEPPRIVLCTPSKCTEAWMLAIFFPDDKQMIKMGWECHPKPEGRLAQQPKAQRFSKNQSDYDRRSGAIQDGWPRIANHLSEAGRFQEAFLASVEKLSSP